VLDLSRVHEVVNASRFKGVTEHALFKRPVGDGETTMLSLVLRPGVNHECFQIFSRHFRIVENDPSCCSVTTPNPFVAVNGCKKRRCMFRIDLVFDGHKNRDLVRRREDFPALVDRRAEIPEAYVPLRMAAVPAEKLRLNDRSRVPLPADSGNKCPSFLCARSHARVIPGIGGLPSNRRK